jgi:single stranded DNA-binding protein
MYRNLVLLQGNLGADAEKRVFDDATKFVLRVATTRRWRDKEGGTCSSTAWHTVILRVTTPSQVSYYEDRLKKGVPVDVEGSIDYRNYTKDQVQHTTTEIHASRVQVLEHSARPAAATAAANASADATASAAAEPHPAPTPEDVIW